jgi:uncharacterized protein with GYD domain
VIDNPPILIADDDPGEGSGSMPKYLVRASLSADGLKGTLKEGGTARRDAVANLVRSVGGSLDAFYYAFGEDDI